MLDLFHDWRSERAIMKVMRGLARQRVALILQPGNFFVIERAADTHSDDARAALGTCLMRGWVEILTDAVPTGRLNDDASLPEKPFTHAAPVYRLTDSGWAAINRSHWWAMAEVLVAVLGIILAVLLT
jgi:hypothetical protein